MSQYLVRKMKSNLQKIEERLTQIESNRSPKETISLLGRAIRYLSYRDHSEVELIKKLKPHADSEEQLQVTLQKLRDKQYLSNERFADSFISRKSKNFGMNRLTQEMRQHQLSQPIIQKQLQELKTTEFERAFAVWEKKFGSVATEQRDLAKQMRFLVSRGFDLEIVYRIVRGKTPD